MPWTLYRYILKDLIKLLVMSLAILVIVIAVAVAIRPLTKGQLGAWTLLKFVGLSAPTILDIALPFASAFASTLVFHRLISDNEIVACRASGMSFRVVFTPVAFLGLILTVLMFLLSSWVIPEFSRLAAKTIQTDAIKIVVNELREKHMFRQGNNIIYADQVQEIALEPGDMGNDDQETKQLRLVMLQGVAFGQLDNEGVLRSDSTVERADLILSSKNDQSWVTLRLHNATHYSGQVTQPWGTLENGEYPLAIPNPFRNKLRFLSAADLRRIEKFPETFKDLQKLKIALCSRMAERIIYDQIFKQFNDTALSTGTFTLMGMTDDYQYVIHAASAQQIDQRNIKLLGTQDQPIQIDYYLSGKPYTRTTSPWALLALSFDEDLLNMQLQLGPSEVTDLRKRQGYATQHGKTPPIRPLRWPDTAQGSIMQVLMSRSIFELQDTIAQRYHDAPTIVEASQTMNTALVDMGWEIMCLRHQRAASSMGCLLILLLGAMMTCHMQGRTPLVIYFWSFSLAAIAVILTRSSGNMVKDQELPLFLSVLLIWSGNLLLLGILTGLSWRLSKPRN
ncbi:MAG: LptF/LptG family permease [Phycisphaeraceae bacterium]|nr:LptF/LptG family permease [Phycisphaeraceae bacterium]